MKVVLLHDWLTGFRGGERVLEAFCEMFPEAPIYTLIYRPGQTSPQIEKHPIHASFLNQIPGIASQYRKFLPFFPRAAEALHIKEQPDLVLSSSHAVIKGVQKPPGAIHISYIHSPMRYLYDQYDAYFGPSAPFYQRWGMKVFKNHLTQWDLKSNENVDQMVANSSFVQKRIQQYYQRTSVVVHPFVDLEEIQKSKDLSNSSANRDESFLMVTAFAPNKRVDLAIRAFNDLEIPLVIIGSGQQEKWLKEIAGPHIQFLGNASRAEVLRQLARTQALIFPGVEDFGITPLEALASGTPVIALKKGGVLDSLTPETAVFFGEELSSENSPTNDFNMVNALKAAVLEFQRKTWNRVLLKNRASEFSKQRFQTQMIQVIEQAFKERTSH